MKPFCVICHTEGHNWMACPRRPHYTVNTAHSSVGPVQEPRPISELRGALPGLTGDKPSWDYVRELREGAPCPDCEAKDAEIANLKRLLAEAHPVAPCTEHVWVAETQYEEEEGYLSTSHCLRAGSHHRFTPDEMFCLHCGVRQETAEIKDHKRLLAEKDAELQTAKGFMYLDVAEGNPAVGAALQRLREAQQARNAGNQTPPDNSNDPAEKSKRGGRRPGAGRPRKVKA